ncbi:MAG TPA: transglutaminase domain-containing protein, partial [Trueperaceae bacterium]|nr:transglutaminase domain-containing protein [Trueperaceae bacterium]
MDARLRGRDGSFRVRALVVATLACTVWLAAAEGVPLTLPAEADLAAHAALVPACAPERPADGWDLVAVENAALAQADQLPAELWEVEALAAALGVEAEAAFTFIRDHLSVDSYPGVLRGAAGALAARAGNAWDRALLLQALIDHHGYRTRLAFGELDDGAASAVVEAAALGAPQPLESATSGSAATTALATRAWRDHALLTAALGESGVLQSLGAGLVSADARGAVRSHVWVQVEQIDDTWLDLDPTLPDAAPGATLTAVTSTLDEVPAEARHQVVVRVLVETLADG